MATHNFHRKRVEVEGTVVVETGIRRKQVQIRVKVGETILTLTPDEAYDVADALDRAIEAEENEPLLEHRLPDIPAVVLDEPDSYPVTLTTISDIEREVG